MVGTKLYSHLALRMSALNYIFPVFSFARPSFLWQKAESGFHSTESNGSFFLSSSPGGVSTPLTAQTDP